MTIKISNNTARLLQCAIAEYNKSLTDKWVNEEDQKEKDRIEECIFELEAVDMVISEHLDY